MANTIMMLYNHEIDGLLQGVAQKLQIVREQLETQMRESENLPLYPLPPITGQAGRRSTLQVSTIVESSLVALARDIKRASQAKNQIAALDLPRYVEQYLRLRKIKGDTDKRHSNEMMISLSEAGIDAISTIEEFLAAHVDAKYLYPPPTKELNRKLVFVIALLYANQPAV
jgi:hypothetical protein